MILVLFFATPLVLVGVVVLVSGVVVMVSELVEPEAETETSDEVVLESDLSNTLLNVDFTLVSSYLIGLSNLKSLVLKNANLSGSVIVAAKYQCGVSLTSIDLAENTISRPVSDILSFGVFSNLKSLNLSKNSIDPLGNKLVKGATFSLQVLDLSYNNISGLSFFSWLSSTELSELKFFSIKGNRLAGSIPELDFKNLSYLDLSANNFSTVFPSFKDCSNLQRLDLSSNKFYGDIGASLSLCGKLSFLNLTNNKFVRLVPKLPSESPQFLYLQGMIFRVFSLTRLLICAKLW
ncbi:hypothetical protein CQW23_32137 [Capsicum baccatum]|uniref:Uncharacterized protein n=1 Tax=Capsicum baccatum TaxID=33114 RepID=A0A2G2V5J7_CAPBA|nr:hypothetical protein CQW23_32137 [Capsicum baccatum]